MDERGAIISPEFNNKYEFQAVQYLWLEFVFSVKDGTLE